MEKLVVCSSRRSTDMSVDDIRGTECEEDDLEEEDDENDLPESEQAVWKNTEYLFRLLNLEEDDYCTYALQKNLCKLNKKFPGHGKSLFESITRLESISEVFVLEDMILHEELMEDLPPPPLQEELVEDLLMLSQEGELAENLPPPPAEEDLMLQSPKEETTENLPPPPLAEELQKDLLTTIPDEESMEDLPTPPPEEDLMPQSSKEESVEDLPLPPPEEELQKDLLTTTPGEESMEDLPPPPPENESLVDCLVAPVNVSKAWIDYKAGFPAKGPFQPQFKGSGITDENGTFFQERNGAGPLDNMRSREHCPSDLMKTEGQDGRNQSDAHNDEGQDKLLVKEEMKPMSAIGKNLLTTECHQISEVVNCVFHSVLFHRTLGKFHYHREGSYSIGTVGYEDIDCDFIDLTYVRCASSSLARRMNQYVSAFDQAIRDPNNVTENGIRSGQISLEFYNKKKVNWPFASECLPWEVWTVRIEIKPIRNEIERQMNREYLGELVGDKVVLIAEVMNRQQYVPKIPPETEVDLIFDTSYPDIQPYLFRISHSTTSPPSTTSVGKTVRRIFRETLAF